MRLKVEHWPEYHYGARVALLPHRLVLTPRDSADLTTLKHSL
ncbi:transglutaminase N-terminal domain-containing protein [Sphingomonas immobilis]